MFQKQEKGLNDPEGPSGPSHLWDSGNLTLAGGALGKARKDGGKSTGLGAGKPSLDLCCCLSLGVSEPQFPHV